MAEKLRINQGKESCEELRLQLKQIGDELQQSREQSQHLEAVKADAERASAAKSEVICWVCSRSHNAVLIYDESSNSNVTVNSGVLFDNGAQPFDSHRRRL